MGGKKFILLVLIVMFSGFTGGAFSDCFFQSGARANNKTRKEISAEAFHLIDKDGKHRASFSLSIEGHPIIFFKNPSNQVIAYFGVARSQPMIGFHDDKNRIRLSMALGKNGNPQLFFSDDKKKPRMGIAVGEKGDTGIIIYDDENAPRMSMLVQDKSPRIAFIEGKKNLNMLISTEKNGNSGMTIQNQHGKVALGLVNKNPTLMLNKTSDTGLVSGFAPDGTPLMALRENRHVTWVAPPGKKAEVESIDPAADWRSITDTLLKQPKF